MSGYQVQNPNMFTAVNVGSPFSPLDALQNDMIYNLQSFAQYSLGQFGSNFPGGNIYLDESHTNPETPYTLTIDQMCNSRLDFNVVDGNTGAFSVGGGPATGTFNPALLKTYYVNDNPLGFTTEGDYLNLELYVQFWQKWKGSYGFNQIPLGVPLVESQAYVARGTAICYGYSTSADNPNAVNGVLYYRLVVNPADFAGAPYYWDLTAATALTVDAEGLNTNLDTSIHGQSGNFQKYTYTDDIVFSTLFPVEYNTPASKCPKANLIPSYIPYPLPWPVPL